MISRNAMLEPTNTEKWVRKFHMKTRAGEEL